MGTNFRVAELEKVNSNNKPNKIKEINSCALSVRVSKVQVTTMLITLPYFLHTIQEQTLVIKGEGANSTRALLNRISCNINHKTFCIYF
jgi:hypothetical protein